MDKKSILKDNDVRWDTVEHRPRRIVGQIEVNQKRTPEDTVRAFLADHEEVLKLSTQKKDLKLIQETESPLGCHLRFQQYIDGTPVFGGIVVVHLDKKGNIKQINADHELDSRIPRAAADKMVTKKEAEKIAREAITEPINPRPKAKVRIENLYYPAARGLVMSWCVTIPTINPPHHWRVFVDAYSSEILAIDDMIDFSVQGEGLVFNPNPVVTANDNTFLDGVTSEATLNAERVTGTLNELDNPVSGQHYLRGRYVEIVELAAPAIGIPSEADRTQFKYDRTDDNFEAASIYYHIDTLQRFIQNTLKITSACPVTPPDTRIHADPHDNSKLAAWYDRVTQDLHFSDSGPGKPDRGEDGDCMAHEYGHAILDTQITGWHAPVPGAVPARYEARAIGEGFGDVLACLYFVEAGAGYQREVFEDWIFAPNGLRRVDNPTDYDAFQTGSGHHYPNSEIWSGSIWDIFLAMGGDSVNSADWAVPRDELLRALITSHQLYTASEPMADAAEALVKTHCDLDDQCGRHAIEMLDVFHDRKLLKCNVGSDLQITQLWSQQDSLSTRSWEQVEAGQDNWFYATITNASTTTTARALVVTFSFKSPFSTPVYPGDFRDNIISATVEFTLDPGATKTVEARWPKELIPPIPTGATQRHGCILAEIYNPEDHVPAGVTNIGSSNGKLKQRNTNIVDLLPDEDTDYFFDISSFHLKKEEFARLEVIRPQKLEKMEISFSHRNPLVVKKLLENVKLIKTKAVRPVEGIAATGTKVSVLEPTRVSIRRGVELPLIFHLARGSSMMVPDQPALEEDAVDAIDEDFARCDVDLDESGNEPVLRLRPGRRVGLPYMMKPRDRARMRMKIRAPRDAKPGDRFTVEVVQRNRKGELLGGFDIQVNIVDKK